ncbi:hypothetical protein [Polynucleobacter sp. MWH-UH23A]|uniref:heavy-metal-associated domain-containing protein n=1 Tax=Polynucleobacter sp. MWH-UH23A TaxID=1855613 RepID=UPI003364D0F4
MKTINLNVQGISSAASIKIIEQALKAIEDISSIHVDWESGRIQIQREMSQSDDIIHALNVAGCLASLDLDEQDST